jgi:hypothetical protein
MTAFANFAARVQLRAAFGALLLPSLANRLFDLCVCEFRLSKPDDPRLIRLLHGALRMNPAHRIRGSTADWTEMFRRCLYDDDGFFATHVVPRSEGGPIRGLCLEGGLWSTDASVPKK